jgi:hypothetical protein
MAAARLADDFHVAVVRECLEDHDGLEHLRARRRADLITLESGPKDDPIPHARLRRVAAQTWTVECATHNGRWERTGIRGPLADMIELLVSTLPWIVAPRE